MQVDGDYIELVTHARLLGVDFNFKLLWLTHVANILIKLSGVSAVIHKLRNTLSYSWLIKLYNSHFLLYLLHCSTVWGYASKHLRRKIDVMQKQVLKNILQDQRQTSST